MKIEKDVTLKERIIAELKAGRSPDEIAGMLRLEGVCIGKDAIYKWLYSSYGNKYTHYLCTRRKKKKLQKRTTKRTLIPNRIGIEHRPQEGIHAEGDTLVSPKKAHTTVCASMVVVQKSKLMQGNILSGFKPEYLERSLTGIRKRVVFDDITLDNGIENRNHEQLSFPVYFCAAHHPWEKPLVEQSIGLLRRWCYPKGTDLSKVSETEYQQALHYLNHKKRKSLGYKSAYEVSVECGILKELPVEEVAFHYRI